MEKRKTNLKTSSSARNTERECSTASDMRIIAFTQQLHNPRNLPRILEQQECQRSDSGTADIIRGIRDGDM
jgi:hypothetical protein